MTHTCVQISKDAAGFGPPSQSLNISTAQLRLTFGFIDKKQAVRIRYTLKAF